MAIYAFKSNPNLHLSGKKLCRVGLNQKNKTSLTELMRANTLRYF